MARHIILLAAGLAALIAAGPSRAELVTRGPQGFTSSSSARLSKAPADVWAALVAWHRWWDPAHSYSGQAGAIRLEADAGGALLERWDGGSVRHASVLASMPPVLLRLEGGLGPLQALPVNAVLDFTLKPDGPGTLLSMEYRVAGTASGLEAMAEPVDAVMSAAFRRLVKHIGGADTQRGP